MQGWATWNSIILAAEPRCGHNSHVEKVTISQLKNSLSAYLKKVQAGQTVLVLDRDQPIAKIERMGASEKSADRLSRLERLGVLRRATSPLSVKALRSGAPRSGQSVVQALLDERRESR